jgi:hypothetical protein
MCLWQGLWLVQARSFVFAGLSSVLAGCAIHPLPDDVTRKTTNDIVGQIRCEAKRAVVDHGRGLKNAAIAYEFTFDITETNNASADATWTFPFLTGGNLSLTANAGANRIRNDNRNFKIVDSFDDLRKVDCSTETLEKDWVYPIAGDIGIYEVVATFAKLQRGGDLKKGEVYSFADTLLFTTTFNAGVTPKLTLNPMTEQFRLTEANANLSAIRLDSHKVTVGLAADPQPTTANMLRSHAITGRGIGLAPFSLLGSNNSLLSTTIIQSGSDVKSKALLELDRQRILQAIRNGSLNVLGGP